MKFKKLLFFIISASLAFAGCDSKKEDMTQKKEIKEEVVKKVESTYSLTSVDSTIINIEKVDDLIKFKGYEGKVILLNFWATWCPPCKAEIPHLNNLKEKYKDSFEVIAVNMGNGSTKLTEPAVLQEFIEKYKINYVVTNAMTNFDIAKLMGGITNIPTMFMIGPKGKVVQKYVGIVPEEMMETDIKKALGK